jgi:nucleotide-binding universal stress UspA family protein
MGGSAQLAGIREAFIMTINPTGHAFSYKMPSEADYQGLCEEAEWKLAALLPPLESDRLCTRVVVGDAADEILRVATEERADLIITAIQAKKGWRRMHLDNTAEKVVQRSPIPVMTLWIPRNAPADRGRPRDLPFAE